MMAAVPGNRNAAIGAAVRQVVAQHAADTFPDAAPRAGFSKLSDAVEGALQPDVSGVPGTWVKVTSRGQPHRFYESLETAQRAAALTGYKRGAVIYWRPSHPIGASLAVLALDDLLALIAAAEGSSP